MKNILSRAGLDHLLASGRGVGGQGEEATELHMACFMGLVSFLAGRPEVLRVAPKHRMRFHNAAARANIQSANVTLTPLTDAGLNGTGEVVQVKPILLPLSVLSQATTLPFASPPLKRTKVKYSVKATLVV